MRRNLRASGNTGELLRQADARRRRNGPRKATFRRPITVRLRGKSCPAEGPDVPHDREKSSSRDQERRHSQQADVGTKTRSAGRVACRRAGVRRVRGEGPAGVGPLPFPGPGRPSLEPRGVRRARSSRRFRHSSLRPYRRSCRMLRRSSRALPTAGSHSRFRRLARTCPKPGECPYLQLTGPGQSCSWGG